MQKRNTTHAVERDGRKTTSKNGAPDSPFEAIEDSKKGTKIDQLGIERGQNAEKGNTVIPENIRDEKEASH